METLLRVYCSARDNTILYDYIKSLQGVQLITFEYNHNNIDQLLQKLLKYKVDVVVQIAPQWEWGRYLEVISTQIMNRGMKLLCGEGAMFRWMGDERYCGSDIGFYLSPWGYSGHSKLAYELPVPEPEDFRMANIIRQEVPRWTPETDDILIVGQLDNDRARYFRGSTKNALELIHKCIRFWGSSRLVYRPHPEPWERIEHQLGDMVRIEQSGLPLKDILSRYSLCVSANSTATIEAMCAGMPTMNDGVGPWSGARVVQRVGAHIDVYSYDDYLAPLASIVHLHYLKKWDYGTPFVNALKFYSLPKFPIFNFHCNKYDDEAQPWKGTYDY